VDGDVVAPMVFRIEVWQEDGRWTAGVNELSSVMAYDATLEEARVQDPGAADSL